MNKSFDKENENLNERFDQSENVNNEKKENYEKVSLNENLEKEIEIVPELRRSQRNIKKPSRFDDNFVYSGCIYVSYCSAGSSKIVIRLLNVMSLVFG